MIERRPFDQLAAADHGWLKAKHHFSFGEFTDPIRMGWGASMERRRDRPYHGLSTSSPRQHGDHHLCPRGCVTHKDSLGNEGRTEVGDVQVMSAGSGIRHAEYNLEPGPTRILQIWIMPTRRGGSPAWGSQPFPKGEGMVIVALDYRHAGQMTLDEITGGSPYGATTIAGGDGSRQPTANELQGARYQRSQDCRDSEEAARLKLIVTARNSILSKGTLP
jgi:hypothetical protein